jgi:hypothetical protein
LPSTLHGWLISLLPRDCEFGAGELDGKAAASGRTPRASFAKQGSGDKVYLNRRIFLGDLFGGPVRQAFPVWLRGHHGISPDRTTIDFDAHGIKKFVTSLMVVKPAEGAPPKRRRAKRAKPAKTEATVVSRVFVPGAK